MYSNNGLDLTTLKSLGFWSLFAGIGITTILIFLAVSIFTIIVTWKLYVKAGNLDGHPSFHFIALTFCLKLPGVMGGSFYYC